jgi:hypothetical protein
VIFFENLAAAGAAAAEVVVEDTLDAAVDLATVELGPIRFGRTTVTPVQLGPLFESRVDLRPTLNLAVRIRVRLDQATRTLQWRLTAIDPATEAAPSDPLLGFLPPNLSPPEGQGSVAFSVMPRAGLPTGTIVRNQARIVFDTNAPIETNTTTLILDYMPPTTRVHGVAPVRQDSSFLVEWSGTDTGSGIHDYTILVSIDGGPFLPWLTHTATTSATFIGEAGRTYGFISVGRDQTGNTEATPSEAQAVTTVGRPDPQQQR